MLSLASFVGALAASEFRDPFGGFYATLTTFSWLYAMVLVIDLFRIRTIGAEGVFIIKLALLDIATACLGTLVVCKF